MLLRKLGSVLRGKATRLQVMLACVLGGLLGFVPGFFLPSDLAGGFAQAPGLILLLLCVALIANANLAIFGLATLIAKLLSLPLLPASYAVGTWLVDGPLQGLFAWLANSQVTAWFGLEHYATTGGIVLGLVFGTGLGVTVNRLLRAIRRHMAGLETSSERYQKLASKWWVKLLTWVFLGKGKGKKSWQDLSEQTGMGMPIRILGVGLAALFGASVFVFQQWLSTPILTENLHAALAAGNGATVDLERASLHLGDGEIRVQGLALADRGDLGKDVFAADELVLKIDMAELLRRRFVVDEVRAVRARAGTKRATPGVLLPAAEPEPEPAPPPAGMPTLDDYLEQYELYKQRFEQTREWVELVFADGEAGAETPPPTEAEVVAEREAQLEQVGLAGVIARHLLREGPRVLIREVDIEGITWTRGGAEEVLSLRLRNISSDPSLVDEAPSVAIGTASESFAVALGGGVGGGPGIGMAFSCRGVDVDRVFGGVRLDGQQALRGGTFDFECRGALHAAPGRAMTMDLPFAVTLHDTTLTLPGAGATPVEQLAVPLALRGDVSRPTVHFESKALREALLAAGKQQLARFVEENAGKLLGDLSGKLPGELQGLVDPSKTPAEMADAAKQMLADEAAKAKAELEAKAKKELEEKAKKEAEKLLPGLGGLLPGKKKKEGGQ